jgi:DNA (cytosine-5)-methyltransferase 1
MKLQVLDLFSGIGAYALGLERAGMKVAAFCEIDPFCRRVLRKHWPDTPIYDDVTKLSGDALRRDGIAVDVICGGWPCQDISPAGTGSGLDGARSGLWSEVSRLAGELRPRFLVLENSSNLLSINRGADFGRVLGDLAALGYDAEWHCLPAAAFDAPHIRDRLWIVANRRGSLADAVVIGCDTRTGLCSSDAREHGRRQSGDDGCEKDVPGSERKRAGRGSEQAGEGAGAADVADAYREGLEIGKLQRRVSRSARSADARENAGLVNDPSGSLANAHGVASFGASIARKERHSWEPEPDVGRVDVRAADTVDRIHALGNCNPPIVPELIGRAILSSMEAA